MKTVMITSLFALSLAAIPALFDDGTGRAPAPPQAGAYAQGEADQVGRALAENEANGWSGRNYAENETNGWSARNYAENHEAAVLDRLFIHSGPVAIEHDFG